jgi:hypothetical protein
MSLVFRAARRIRVPPAGVAAASFATAAPRLVARAPVAASSAALSSAALLGFAAFAASVPAGLALCSADVVEPATGIAFSDAIDGMEFLGAGVR